MTTQAPELSAALGWPGGISDPALDRKVLLQMVATLRLASQQALDSINELFTAEQSEGGERSGHIRTPATREHLVRIAQARKALHESCGALRAALAQQAEPVEPVAWVASKDGRVIYDDASTDDGLLRVSGDFENDEQRVRYAQRIVDKLNAAPPQRTMVPLTEEEIAALARAEIEALPSYPSAVEELPYRLARAVEKAVWEKNHGQA